MKIVKNIARQVPSIREVFEDRDRLRRDLKESREQLDQAVAAAARNFQLQGRDALRSALRGMDDTSCLLMELNREPVWLPRDTLRTMVHCIFFRLDGIPRLLVETAHYDWMRERLAPGGTFVDVGAATGAICLPLARHFEERLTIVAFEPARAARRLLALAIERNGIGSVDLRAAAVADAPAIGSFVEYAPDETGATPFLPEMSTLSATRTADLPASRYEVPVVTLDQELGPEPPRPPVVVKVDVEGFEAKVLQGASGLLRHRPSWSIDIHSDPFGEGSTEAAVTALLAPHGYAINRLGHVLTAEPLPFA